MTKTSDTTAGLYMRLRTRSNCVDVAGRRCWPASPNLRRLRQIKPLEDQPPFGDLDQMACPGQVLTVDEAAKRLRISKWSLYTLIRTRQLKTFKIGHRRLIAATAVDALIQQLQEEAE